MGALIGPDRCASQVGPRPATPLRRAAPGVRSSVPRSLRVERVAGSAEEGWSAGRLCPGGETSPRRHGRGRASGRGGGRAPRSVAPSSDLRDGDALFWGARVDVRLPGPGRSLRPRRRGRPRRATRGGAGRTGSDRLGHRSATPLRVSSCAVRQRHHRPLRHDWR